jgi:hypothetical protein
MESRENEVYNSDTEDELHNTHAEANGVDVQEERTEATDEEEAAVWWFEPWLAGQSLSIEPVLCGPGETD